MRQMKQTAYVLNALICVSFIALTACSNNYNVPKHTDHVMRASVEMVQLKYIIKPEEDTTDTPSAYTLSELDQFLTQTKITYSDTVLFDIANNTSEKRIAALTTHLKKRGVKYGGALKLSHTPELGSIHMYVERYTATPPECGQWRMEVSNQQRNNTSAHHGCATISALAKMVANPKDLVSGASVHQQINSNQ